MGFRTRPRQTIDPSISSSRKVASTASNVALVTGASSGLGAAIAARLEARGWIVYGASRTGRFAGPRALVLDVTDETATALSIDRIVAEHGRLDAVVANAGINVSAPFEDLSGKTGRAILDTNFWGVINVIRATLPVMRQRRSGTIVTVGSLAGLVAPPGEAFYAASKHALEGFLESLRHEVTPFGVRVMLVEPGFIRTSLASATGSSGGSLGDYARLRRQLDDHWRKSIDGGMAPERVAERIVKAIESRSRRFRLPIGWDAGLVPGLKRIIPEPLFFWVVCRVFGMRPGRSEHLSRPTVHTPSLNATASWRT